MAVQLDSRKVIFDCYGSLPLESATKLVEVH